MKLIFIRLLSTSRVLLTIILAISASLHADDHVTGQCSATAVYTSTDTFADIKHSADELATKWNSRNVLLVFDIDNTLLAMNQDLGSDQWFDWQYGLLNNSSSAPGLIVENFQGLLDAQALLWRLGKMHPPEHIQTQLIRSLQESGFTTLVMTSRSPDNFDITLKSLTENAYDFSRSALPPKQGYAGEFLPYSRADLGRYGITLDEAIKMGLGYASKKECIENKLTFKAPCLKKARPVKYENGIFLTAGQNKGVMLRSLLHTTGFTGARRFAAIIFIDDKLKHVRHVYRAFCNQAIELALFHYTHEATRVREFVDGDKSTVVEEWQKITEILKSNE